MSAPQEVFLASATGKMMLIVAQSLQNVSPIWSLLITHKRFSCFCPWPLSTLSPLDCSVSFVHMNVRPHIPLKGKTSPFWLHLTFITFSQALPPNLVPSYIRASEYEWGECDSVHKSSIYKIFHILLNVCSPSRIQTP